MVTQLVPVRPGPAGGRVAPLEATRPVSLPRSSGWGRPVHRAGGALGCRYGYPMLPAFERPLTTM